VYGPYTYRQYETIAGLLKAYLERYWPGHDGEYDRVTKAGGTYCGTYGPEDIAGAFFMFLDYFMPHKVLCGSGTEKAAHPFPTHFSPDRRYRSRIAVPAGGRA
jgi:hypothetical protein